MTLPSIASNWVLSPSFNEFSDIEFLIPVWLSIVNSVPFRLILSFPRLALFWLFRPLRLVASRALLLWWTSLGPPFSPDSSRFLYFFAISYIRFFFCFVGLSFKYTRSTTLMFSGWILGLMFSKFFRQVTNSYEFSSNPISWIKLFLLPGLLYTFWGGAIWFFRWCCGDFFCHSMFFTGIGLTKTLSQCWLSRPCQFCYYIWAGCGCGGVLLTSMRLGEGVVFSDLVYNQSPLEDRWCRVHRFLNLWIFDGHAHCFFWSLLPSRSFASLTLPFHLWLGVPAGWLFLSGQFPAQSHLLIFREHRMLGRVRLFDE